MMPSSLPPPDSPIFLDRFSGAGGLSLGLRSAGFTSLGAFEWDPVASESYRMNFGKAIGTCSGFGPKEGDLSRINPREIAAKLGGRRLDLLSAGPPCQGFSRVGRGKLNDLKGLADAFRHDPRNKLYKKVLTLVDALRPRIVLLENVGGILHLSGTNMAAVICEALANIGYSPRYAVLNAAWYGVPQSRERVFILAVDQDLCFDLPPCLFPSRTHRYRPGRGSLSGPGKLGLNDPYYFPNQELPQVPSARKAVSCRQALGDLPAFTQHLDFLDPRDGRPAIKGYRSLRSEHGPMPYRLPPSRATAYQKLMRGIEGDSLESERVLDHFCRWVPRDFKTFKLMEEGDCYPQALKIARDRHNKALARWKAQKGRRGPKPLPSAFIPPYRDDQFDEKWKKLFQNKPSWTITAHLGRDTYSHIHYDSNQARAITPREAARLQSFPDTWQFAGNTGEMFRQIGNAVPPLLSKAFGMHIRNLLKDLDKQDQEELQAIS